MRRLLVRADDLGFSDGVNCGIAAAVEAGLVRSIGVMTNMPQAASGLARIMGRGICLGQHTNISTGRPLTDPALIPSLVDAEGAFRRSGAYREAAARGEDFVVLDEVLLEVEAQYARFRELTGSEPSYFEGHAVASPTFFRALEIVAKRHVLPYFPMGAPGEAVRFRGVGVYSYMPADFASYEADPFSALRDCVEHAHEGACDLMVFHPGYIGAYRLDHSSMTVARAREAAMLCDPAVRTWLAAQDIELVTYDDLDGEGA